MRRIALEQRLRKLGWAPAGRASGRNHQVWTHADREFELFVPQYDLIPNAVVERILEHAGE